jgi:ATP-dependent DNA helicase RecQ
VPSRDPILEAAHRLLGYGSLRPGQREAIQSLLDGRDTLAVLATGAGKSAIYELAGPLLEGPTVVVSPLLALQRDQKAALEARGHVVAVALNSSETARERQEVLRLLSGGDRPDFVFLAPEQLANADVLARVAELRPVLLAVDEAHLVSRWGPDFRPDYLRIGPAVESIGRPVVVALTATAAPPVREEILQRLQMRDPAVFVHGFARPNIHLAVHSYFTDEDHKQDVLRRDVAAAVEGRGRGIVYAATHHRVETLAAAFASPRVRAAAYHAGLPKSARADVERRFHDDELDVVIATIAFGMGIDKPDVRWVFHADVSGSLDEYYQEFGRAGRDGDPAEAALYFRREDLTLPRLYASGAGPGREDIVAVATVLAGAGSQVRLADIARQLGLSMNRTEAAAMAIADTGDLVLDPDGTVRVTGSLSGSAAKASELVMARRAVERTRVDAMEAYAEHRGCRWKFVLEYFGEPAPDRCGHCDNDERADANSDQSHPGRPFPRGSRVQHHVFGEGEVVGYVGSSILVAFDRVGYKRLDLGLVAEGHLLDAAP